MIARLRGAINYLQEDRCVIDVSGVGYLVFLSFKTSEFLKQFSSEKEVTLIIETLVKEDAIELYGFVREIEKTWFSELTKVQGVGAKMALKILGFFTIDDLARALISADTKSFTQISGIGAKLAQRITTELKDSPKKLGIDSALHLESEEYRNNNYAQNSIAQDAISALENLGYKKLDASQIIARIVKNNPAITLESLITTSLRELSKNKF